jgi:cytochrome b6-f complex iron-sulfur subunit
VRCQDCHGGERGYDLTFEQRREYLLDEAQPAGAAASRPLFDHGDSFRGKASRADVPDRCGTCHANVEKMNPYGLPTDQLAAYWVSGHGKRLKANGDTHVAVCIDCHGSHDVLSRTDPRSRTYFKNVPDTCGHCHADRDLMLQYDLSPTVVQEYRLSVHGRNVLEGGDAGSPNCATCHGSHAAAPPGYMEVGHVCGKCHQQMEEYFLTSVHGQIPVIARCVGCHGGDGNRLNHRIEKASPPPEQLVQIFTELTKHPAGAAGAKDAAGAGTSTAPADAGSPDGLRTLFAERVADAGGDLQFDRVCLNCHGQQRATPHAAFFQSSDEIARNTGAELAEALRDVQFRYAGTAERVDRVAHGVLLVQEEALRLEDAKTELVALYAFLHTLNRPEIATRAEKVREICAEVNAGLDGKESALRWRRTVLWPIWAFILIFSVFMYRKYLALKHQWVKSGPSSAPGGEAGPVAAKSPAAHRPLPVASAPQSVGRRRFLDIALSGMGLTIVAGLLWPAISYVLPARRRGGGAERVSAGKSDGWAVWEARKVAVRGKPVVIVRNESGFKAFSAVCTHLGCIVHWEGDKREFFCPCHAAVFDVAGKVVSGPPPSPLPEYGVAEVQGDVIVKALVEG